MCAEVSTLTAESLSSFYFRVIPFMFMSNCSSKCLSSRKEKDSLLTMDRSSVQLWSQSILLYGGELDT